MEETTLDQPAQEPKPAPTILFDAAALYPLSLFQAKRDIRYYLNGTIFVSPHPSGGCILASTNGHQMAVWYDQNGKCSEETIIEVSAGMVAASKKKPELKFFDNRRVTVVNGRLVLAAYDIESDTILKEYFIQTGIPLIDAKYPNLARVMPDVGSLVTGCRVSLKAEYLAVLAKVSAWFGKKQRYNYATLYHYTESEGGVEGGKVITRFSCADNFVAITMECRCDIDRNIVPPAIDAWKVWKGVGK